MIRWTEVGERHKDEWNHILQILLDVRVLRLPKVISLAAYAQEPSNSVKSPDGSAPNKI